LVLLRTHINTGHDPDNACSHRLPAHCHVQNTHIDASLDPAIEVDLVEASYFAFAKRRRPPPGIPTATSSNAPTGILTSVW